MSGGTLALALLILLELLVLSSVYGTLPARLPAVGTDGAVVGFTLSEFLPLVLCVFSGGPAELGTVALVPDI